jgi:hypothetical protein
MDAWAGQAFHRSFIPVTINPLSRDDEPMTASEPSPLARFVLFMICLAALGSILAGAHYLTVDLPEQQNVISPENAGWGTTSCTKCKQDCGSSSTNTNYFNCLMTCKAVAC